MGKVTVLEHVGGGKYRVNINFDNKMLELRKTYLQGQITEFTNKLAELETKKAAAKSEWDNANTALNDYINTTPPDEIANDPLQLNSLISTTYKKRAAYDLVAVEEKPVRLQKIGAERELKSLNEDCPSTVETIAWCVEPVDTLAGDMASIEVDYALEQIRQTGQIRNDTGIWLPASPAAPDSILQHPMATSVHANWFNLAIHPAMQKYKGRYRIAVINAVYEDSNTCDLTFMGDYNPREYTSRLINYAPVNPDTGGFQRANYTGALIKYSVCDAKAFVAGDKVIVDLHNCTSTPTVIGFYENPRFCPIEWPAYIDVWIVQTADTPSVNIGYMEMTSPETAEVSCILFEGMPEEITLYFINVKTETVFGYEAHHFVSGIGGDFSAMLPTGIFDSKPWPVLGTMRQMDYPHEKLAVLGSPVDGYVNYSIDKMGTLSVAGGTCGTTPASYGLSYIETLSTGSEPLAFKGNVIVNYNNGMQTGTKIYSNPTNPFVQTLRFWPTEL